MNVPTLWTSRAWRIVKGEASHQASPTTTMADDEEREPGPRVVLHTGEHMFVFSRRPVTNTMVPCARMNSTNQQNARKWMDRAACRFSTRPSKPSRLEIAGLCIRPVRIETGAAMNTVMK